MYGDVVLKFFNEAKMKKWVEAINERVTEMKISNEVKATEILDYYNNLKLNPYDIYFGLEINMQNIEIKLIDDDYSKDLFKINFNVLLYYLLL